MTDIGWVVGTGGFLFFIAGFALFIYICYLFMRRVADLEEINSKYTKKQRAAQLIFLFLYSALSGGLFYLLNGDIILGIIFCIVFFILGALRPERTMKGMSRKSRIYMGFSILAVFLSQLWNASSSVWVGTAVILLTIYLLGKLEEKYFSPYQPASMNT